MSLFCFGICGTMGPLVNHIVLLWSHFENQPPKQELPMAERGDSELIERFLFACTPCSTDCAHFLCARTQGNSHFAHCVQLCIFCTQLFLAEKDQADNFSICTQHDTALRTAPVSFLHDHRLQSAMLSSGKNLLREH